jgi:hypothetical protein
VNLKCEIKEIIYRDNEQELFLKDIRLFEEKIGFNLVEDYK